MISLTRTSLHSKLVWLPVVLRGFAIALHGLALAMIFSSCGRRDPYDTEGEGTWGADPAFVASTIADTLELLTSGLSENSTSLESSAVSLTPNSPTNPILSGSNPQINATTFQSYPAAQLTCLTATNTATVTATFGKALEFSRPGKARQTSATHKERISSSGAETRTWTRPDAGDAYNCETDGRVNLGTSSWSKEENVKGLKSNLKYNNKFLKYEASVQKSGGNVDIGILESSSTGEVVSTYDIPVPKSDATNFFNTKTIEFNVTRTLKTGGNRGKTTLSYVARTKPESLLRAEIRRSNATGAVSLLFLQTGILSLYDAQKKQTLELSINSLKFDFSDTNLNKCVPVDGNISGRVVPEGGVSSEGFYLKFQDSLVESGISLNMNKTGAKDCESCAVRWCDFFQ